MSIKKERRKLVVAGLDMPSGELVAADLGSDIVGNAKLDGVQTKTLRFKYDFAKLAGGQAAKTLTDNDDAAQTIPDNAVIISATLEAITSVTSDGSATIKLGITGDDDCFIAATAYDHGEYTAAAISALSAGIPIKTTAAVSVLATIATADIKAGKFYVWVDYREGA